MNNEYEIGYDDGDGDGYDNGYHDGYGDGYAENDELHDALDAAEVRLERMAKRVDSPELLEGLSALEHARWSKWMAYLFMQGRYLDGCEFAINAECVQRWHRQLETDYKDLSEKEKESDREQVRPVLDIIRAALTRYDAGPKESQ